MRHSGRLFTTVAATLLLALGACATAEEFAQDFNNYRMTPTPRVIDGKVAIDIVRIGPEKDVAFEYLDPSKMAIRQIVEKEFSTLFTQPMLKPDGTEQLILRVRSLGLNRQLIYRASLEIIDPVTQASLARLHATQHHPGWGESWHYVLGLLMKKLKADILAAFDRPFVAAKLRQPRAAREVAAAAPEKPEPAKIARSTSLSGAAAAMTRSSAGAQSVASGPDLPEGVYTLESKIDFNVLDKVFFDPKTGTVSLIGHRDSRYGSSRIPYLQHLAALLDQPHPQISLDWTPQSERQVDRLFRRMDSASEMGRLTAQSISGSWFGSDGRPTLLGQRMFRMFGIVPSGGSWRGMTRFQVIATLLENTGNRRGAAILRGLEVFQRDIKTSRGSQALVDFLAIADASMSRQDAINLYNQLVNEVRQGRRSKESSLAVLFRKLLAGMEQGLQFSRGSITNIFDREMRRRRNAGQAYDVAIAEANRQMKTVLRRALETALSRKDEVVMPVTDVEAELGAKPMVVPRFIRLDPKSQLARVMFEADYLGKSLLFKPELKNSIPGYKTEYAFYADRPGRKLSGATTDRRMWISIASLDLRKSKSGKTLETRKAMMRFNVRNVRNGRDVTTSNDPYGNLLTSLYGKFSEKFPVLHELREIATLSGVAKWIQTQSPGYRLPRSGRARWSAPQQVPGFIYLIWSPHRVNVVMVAPGGIDLSPPPSDVTIPLVPVDRLIVDLRSDRVVAPPEIGPGRLTKFVPESAQESIPRPVGWVTQGEVKGKTVTAVTLVLDEGEEDRPTVLRRGSDLDAQALILWKRNDLEGAKQLHRRLASQSQDDPFKRAGYLALLARILAENGEYEAAIRELDKAKQLAPGHPIFFMLNTEILVESGNIEEAISELEHYLSLDPENQAAAKVLSELREGWKGLRRTPAASGEPRRREHGEGVQARGLISNKGRSAWDLAWALGAHGTRIQALKGKGGEKEAKGEGMQVFDTGMGDPEKPPPLSLTIRGREIKEVPKEVRTSLEWQALKGQYEVLKKKREQIERKIRVLKELEKSVGMTAEKEEVVKEILNNLIKEKLPQVITKQNEVQEKAKKLISFHFDTSEEGKSGEGEPEEGPSESRKGPPNQDPEGNGGAP